MFSCGTFHLERFYDVGEVYDIPRNDLTQNGNDTMVYDAAIQAWRATGECAVKTFVASSGKWRYIDMPLSRVDGGSLDASILCYDPENVLLYQMETVLLEGQNLLSLPDVKYSRFDIVLLNQEGVSFSIDRIQLREQPPSFSKSRFVLAFFLLLAAFFLVTGILSVCYQKAFGPLPWYTLAYLLQSGFLYVGRMGRLCVGGFSAKTKARVRSGLFCVLFLLVQAAFVLGYYGSNDWYRYLALGYVLIIVVIALFCWEGALSYQNWNNKLVASWLWLWILSMISDFMVEKKYPYTGYIMVFAFGFLFFMWGNMKRKEQMLADFLRGIRWSFWPNAAFCLLFRPYLPGYRYLGAAFRPGYFAMYLLFAWLAFLVDVDFSFKDKASLRKDLLDIFALGMCGLLLWRTQSISSMLPAALAALIVCFRLFRKRKRARFLGFALYLFVFAAGYAANGYGIYVVPRLVDAEIKFDNDFYQETVTEHPFLMTVQAAEEGDENRIWHKIKTSASLEALTSGRTLYWKAYLREINLWGHKNNARFLGEARLPHNALIAIMYRYGIFAAAPYLLLLLYSCLYACSYFRKRWRNNKYAFFFLANLPCCGMLLLLENIDRPFSWIGWFCLYVPMGAFFEGVEEETAGTQQDGGYAANALSGFTISRRLASRIRIALFFLFFVYMLWVYNYDLYSGKAYFKYHNLLAVVALLLLACLSKGKAWAFAIWDRVILGVYVVFWTLACVSDFIVTKRLHFVGWVMLLAVGVIFWAKRHMERLDDLFWDLLRAVECLAAAGMVYNMFFRVKYSGLLYHGYMKSASDFGACSVFVFLVFAVELYECWRRREFGIRLAYAIGGMGISWLQVLLSRSGIAIVFLAVLSVIVLAFALRAFVALPGVDKGKILAYLALALVVTIGYDRGVRHIPEMMQTALTYPKERMESCQDPTVIAYWKQSGDEVYQKVRARDAGISMPLWKEYVQQANLFGHKLPKARIDGKRQNPDNQFLQILYRYGLAAACAYALLFLLALWKSCRVLWETRRNLNGIDLFSMGVLAYWHLVGFFGNLEFPYYQPAWLTVYLLLIRYMVVDSRRLQCYNSEIEFERRRRQAANERNISR